MNKYCGRCGAELDANVKFCPHCGETVIADGWDEMPTEILKSEEKGRRQEYGNVPVNNYIEPKQIFINDIPNVNIQSAPKSESTKTKKIIAVILVIALVMASLGAGFYIFRLKKDLKDSKEELIKVLSENTEKKMVAFYYDDYNNDGSNEAFAIVGKESDREEAFEKADIWFVDDNTNKEIAADVSGHSNGMLQSGETKYVSIEKKSGKEDDSVSLIYGVKDGEAYEPEISGKFSEVHQEGDKIVGENKEDGMDYVISLNDNGSFSFDEPKEPLTSENSEKPTDASETNTAATKVNETAPAVDSKNKMNEAYKRVLKDILNNPNDYYGVEEGLTTQENEFLIADVNNDGTKELVVRFISTFVAGMYTQVWTYNKSSDKAEKLFITEEYSEFYSNGYVKANASHNQSHGQTIWPHGVYKINGNTLDSIYSVLCFDRELSSAGDPFPEAEDKDGDGVVYEYYDGNAGKYIEKKEYDEIENKYIPESKRIKDEYKTINSANIEAIK